MPPPLPYTDLLDFFTSDWNYGQLCDIVVPGAKPHTWAALFQITAANYPYRYSISYADGNDVPSPLPDDPLPVIESGQTEAGPCPSLSFELVGLTIGVNFASGVDWIELDCDRTAITPERYEAIARFMQRLGDASGQDVFMTPEMNVPAAVMVYDAAARTFRRPRRAAGPPTDTRNQLLAALKAALKPIRDTAPLPRPHTKGSPRDTRLLSNDLLRTALSAIDRITATHPELQLQDELTLEEREHLAEAWSLLATIIDPGVGVDRTPYRLHYERYLITLAHQVVSKHP